MEKIQRTEQSHDLCNLLIKIKTLSSLILPLNFLLSSQTIVRMNLKTIQKELQVLQVQLQRRE